MKLSLTEQRELLKKEKNRVVREEFADELAKEVQKQVTEQVHQTRMETARQMKAKGFENALIAELTGLSVEEVAQL